LYTFVIVGISHHGVAEEYALAGHNFDRTLNTLASKYPDVVSSNSTIAKALCGDRSHRLTPVLPARSSSALSSSSSSSASPSDGRLLRNRARLRLRFPSHLRQSLVSVFRQSSGLRGPYLRDRQNDLRAVAARARANLMAQTNRLRAIGVRIRPGGPTSMTTQSVEVADARECTRLADIARCDSILALVRLHNEHCDSATNGTRNGPFLDLHGLQATEAVFVLDLFLSDFLDFGGSTTGWNIGSSGVVTVVTGAGRHSGRAGPVLIGAVETYCRNANLRCRVNPDRAGEYRLSLLE